MAGPRALKMTCGNEKLAQFQDYSLVYNNKNVEIILKIFIFVKLFLLSRRPYKFQ